jgi:hypothetical protein
MFRYFAPQEKEKTNLRFFFGIFFSFSLLNVISQQENQQFYVIEDLKK